MIVFLLLAVALAVPISVGFLRSVRERGVNRQKSAAFIGFSAAIVATTAMIVGTSIVCWHGPVRFRLMGEGLQTVIAISSIVQHLSTLVAFCAGFFTVGIWRVSLIVFGPVLFLMYLLAAFSNAASNFGA